MQTVSSAFLQALNGSLMPVAQVDAWYGGQLVKQALPFVSGSLTIDSTRTIAGSLDTFTFVSKDGSLAPTRWDSPLACYGSELNIRAGLQLHGQGLEMISLGWFRIDSYTSNEFNQLYSRPASGIAQWIPRGGIVTNQASDRMALLDDAQFLAPQQPAQLASVMAEIANLCFGIVPVESLSAITDAAIPATVSYGQSRVQALQDLAAVLGCTASMSPNGGLQLVSTTPAASVWTVSLAGRNGAPILNWQRSGDRTGLYNAVVSTGTAVDGTALQGVSQVTSGPLRFGGPFGQVPFGHFSPILATQAATQADSDTTLADLSTGAIVVIPLTLPPNIALVPGDVITVDIPKLSVTGIVQSLTIPFPITSMQVNLAVSRSQLWGIL